MKPKEKKPETVFRIISSRTGESVGSYSRACCDEYDFRSISEARNANFSGTFNDKLEYKVAKYKVTYELLDEDCDPPTDEERAFLESKRAEEEERRRVFNEKYGHLPLDKRWEAAFRDLHEEAIKSALEKSGEDQSKKGSEA